MLQLCDYSDRGEYSIYAPVYLIINGEVFCGGEGQLMHFLMCVRGLAAFTDFAGK